MVTPALSRTWRTGWRFSVILVVCIILFDITVIVQQNRLLHKLNNSHIENEFELFGKLVSSSLTRGDYANVEQSVAQWGKEQENIIDLKISAQNGYIISDFKRDTSTSDINQFQGRITYNQDRSATITMTRDTSAIAAAINKLSFQLISFSIILVALLAFLLQRTAVKPLQNEINEHEQTEYELEKQAAVLQEINKELEAFSYSLSHDLRAPLRSISGFSQIILEETSGKLNKEENEYFQRILVASNRMAELIDDMLNLARVTRSDMNLAIVDLSSLAKETIDRLMHTDQKRHIDWHIREDLTTFGDKKLLALVFENLLGNAYKYTANNDHARIEFGCKTMTDSVHGEIRVYFVCDNGIGFDMQYANKLFKPFHRLHKDPSFEGTGVGLATVQRIIHRHLGRIWAEAEPDKGACFFFILGEKVTNS